MSIKKVSLFIAVFAVVAFGAAMFAAQSASAAMTSASQITRDLTLGSIGDDVKVLQQFLNNNGYPVASSGVGAKGHETTVFAGLTKAALIKFQTAKGLSATGVLNSATRSAISAIINGTSSASSCTCSAQTATISTLTAENTSLKSQIASLQTQVNTLLAKLDDGGGDGPSISSIKVTDGGDEGYIDAGDYITITFDEAIDPTTIDSDLDEGSYITGVSYSSTGGVSLSSAGKVTIKNIAAFDMGSVASSRNFTSKIALNSTGKVLTITLTSGTDVEITDEDFSSASQAGGTIENTSGDEMSIDSSINDPTGTFGGANNDGGDSDGLNISSIKAYNGGDDDYVDTGDYITVTFSEAVDPSYINADLTDGSYVTGVTYAKTGGVTISSAGKVTIKNIATFDLGSVDGSGTFTVKLALNSTGKILTITLTSGSDIEISDEDFSDAAQIGGYIETENGDEMDDDSSIDDPTGTFGGSNSGSGDDSDGPSISSIKVYNSGDDSYIDVGDSIVITFDEAIDPDSVSGSLSEGNYITGVESSETGGVTISSAGKVTIKNIATFDLGSVDDLDDDAGDFITKVALNSDGDVLTVTLSIGSDITVDDESFGKASQVGGTIADENGNEMATESSVCTPTGTFAN